MPVEVRKPWVSVAEPLALIRQCELTGVARSTVYAPPRVAVPDEQELTLLGLIDAQYTRHPFYGSRKIGVYLRGLGHSINRKRVQRLMGMLGLAGMAPGPDTSHAHPQHKVYPYVLRGVEVIRPNHVWSTDITYIRLAHGFVYWVAVIDGYSRKVLAWRLSNTLDSSGLEQALRAYGAPEIFNTDQGCQFTSDAFTGGLPTEYFVFYNSERMHQSLGYSTPDEVYRTARGGGAKIVDKYSELQKLTTGLETTTGQRHSAAREQLPS